MAVHHPRKRFGQHFLHDQGVIERIVAIVNPRPGDRLVEIGPGRGALTCPLLEQAGELDVVELDRDLLPLLKGRCTGKGILRIHNCDALDYDFSRLPRDGKRLRVIGNLPYNISTPLLFHLLGHIHCIRDLHFMLQKEVAERLAAQPGNGTYGRLSVMVQYHCAVRCLFSVGRGAFSPPPKVTSAFVRLFPHTSRPTMARDERILAGVVRQAFTQRRKTLRNALKPLLVSGEMEDAGVDPSWRAEQLGVDDYVRLSNLIWRKAGTA